jgi:hypothetical protein
MFNKVFGIGLSKTGTSSLDKALNTMGIKSKHCPTDDTTYIELVSGKYDLTILGQYDAITDIVASPFYAEFDKAYPNSLFILTIRDVNDWLKSMKTHIEKTLLNGRWEDYVKSKNVMLQPGGKRFAKMCSFLHATNYGCLTYSEDRLKRCFELHKKNVTEYFSGTDKLLIMEICNGEGWEKLCPFLDKKIPNLPFPHDNKTKE